MCDLAEILRLSPSGLTRRLDALVRRGWVERRPSVDDRRVLFAHLTAAGRSALEDAAPTHVASVRRHVLEPLGPERLHDLGRIMDTLRRGLSPDSES